LALSGVYGAAARHTERPGVEEETGRYFRGSNRAQLLILAVPVFGAAALAVRPETADYGQIWVIAGSVIWAGASVLLLAVVRPAEAQIRRSAGSGGPEGSAGSGVRAAATRLMWAAATTDVLFVAALALMVTQPA
jgi:hypothetical protein